MQRQSAIMCAEPVAISGAVPDKGTQRSFSGCNADFIFPIFTSTESIQRLFPFLSRFAKQIAG